MAEDIKVVITAEDKASGVFSKLSGSLGSLGSALGNVAKIAGAGLVAGFGAATAFGISAVKAFSEAEQQMAIANKTLENSLSDLTEIQKKHIKGLEGTKDIMGELQVKMDETGKAALKLGIDDEAASVAFAKLFAVTKDVTETQKEVKLAMDLAAYSGRSLEEATKALTMVHAGGARVLKEFGIDVQEGTTALDALDLVQKRVTGSAEAMANTTQGKLNILSESWGNLKEAAGAALAEAVTPFIDQLNTWAQDEETQKKIKEITTEFGELAKKITPLIIEALPKLIKLIENIILIIGEWKSWWDKIVDVLGTVIFNIMKFIDWVKGAIDWVGQLIEKIKELWKEMAANPVQTFNAGVDKVLGAPSRALGLPGFATGGIVPGPVGAPMAAIVHGGETVIPAGGGAGGIVINISGNSFLDDDAPRQMADSIINALKMELKI